MVDVKSSAILGGRYLTVDYFHAAKPKIYN
jgi:hypothetical protein